MGSILHISGNTGPHGSGENKEAESWPRPHNGSKQETERGLSYPHSSSFHGTLLFPLKTSEEPPTALDDLGPHSNLQQALPFLLLTPHTCTAPTAPVGVGSTNANSFKCQLEQHGARKANR